MEIIRVLNNNAVLCRTARGEHRIVLGKGIGFGQHLGNEINPDDSHEVFAPTQLQSLSQLSLMVQDIPLEYVQEARAIIHEHGMHCPLHPTDGTSNSEEVPQSLLLGLADHIQFAIARAHKQQEIAYPLQWEVQQLYPDEYATGCRAVHRINKRWNVILPEAEASAIALHFVNAAFHDSNLSHVRSMTESISTILGIISDHLGITISPQTMEAARFVTHLRYLFVRLSDNKDYPALALGLNPSLSNAYPDAYAAAQRVAEVFRVAHYELNDDEISYLTLHIARLARATQQPS